MPNSKNPKKRLSPRPVTVGEAGRVKKKKEKASGKLGRPANVREPSKLEEMMNGVADYMRLKEDPETTLLDKTRFFDDKAHDFITKYGWEDPFRSLTKDVDGATPEARNRVEAEAETTAQVAKSRKEVNAEKEAEQKRKDEMWKMVRNVRIYLQPDVRVTEFLLEGVHQAIPTCRSRRRRLYETSVGHPETGQGCYDEANETEALYGVGKAEGAP